ncbi:retention module-containing protein [Vibrio aquaticus]|uniref:Retention module-containing protein n=1 Tax=Vibrio aquaticus TaxID=2496559 RepID=A0A3S0N817_9VIBR|nr:retention module-containing protein [Vibrio aquaticus]RTZ18064.1 retention module-containing protein [Vibrio aquaticus]
MNVEVVREAAVAKEVEGEVIAVAPSGSARRLLPGDRIEADEIIITANKAQIVMDAAPVAFEVGENCVACQSQDDLWTTAPLAEEVNFDLSQIDGLEVGEDEFAAIQQAILDGADPTAILEATAAGLNGLSSSISGLATIEATGVEVLASTLFETSGIDSSNTGVNQQDGLRPFIFAAGGESLQTNLVEGNLSQGSYPVSSVSTATIFAGGLALDPDSFVPDTLSLSSLLAELNSDITSNGESVSFTYDAGQNAIIGTLNGEEVLTITIDATSLGDDITLDVTTTIFQPIDHLPSVGGGQVAFSDDQITISFDITGNDSGGNPIRTPIDTQVSISDGAQPDFSSLDAATLYEAGLDGASGEGPTNTFAEGTLVGDLGSDIVNEIQIDVDAFNNGPQSSAITSQGQTVVLEALAGEQGKYIGYITLDGTRIDVLTVTLGDVTTSDTEFRADYQVQLLQELDQPNNGQSGDQDQVSILLPVFAIDADNDQSERSNLVVNVGDDIQVVIDGNLNVVEPTLGEIQTSNVVDVIEQAGADQGKVTFVTFDDVDVQYQQGQTEYPVDHGILHVTADGEVWFVPRSNIDHSTKEQIKHDIVITVTDNDGDELTSNVELIITDGDDPEITAITEATVYEAGLGDGSQVGLTQTEFTGTLSGNLGSDKVTGLQIDLNAFETAQQNSPITSHGKTIALEAVDGEPGVYLGYIKLDDGTRVNVLKVTLGTVSEGSGTFNASYKVELLQEIDQPKQGGAAANDFTSISLPIFATDSDNDESARSNLIIKVGDDIQVVTNGDIEVVESTIGSPNQSDVIEIISKAGADQGEVTSFTFDGKSYTLQDGQTEYSVTDSNSVTVGKVVITPDGNVSFIPESRLDHSTSEEIKHTIVVTVTDQDGDKLESTVNLVIKDGQNPVISNITEASVYEAGLTDGGTQVGQTNTVFDGVLTGQLGSDNVADVQIDLQAFEAAQQTDPITAQGKTIVLEAVSGEPGVYMGYVTIDGSRVNVLKVTLGAVSMNGTQFSSNYKVELLQEIDQPNQGGAQDLDFTSISLPIFATDADNDESARADLVVKVGDDIQVVSDGNISVVESTIGSPNQSDALDVLIKPGADQAKVSSVSFDGVPVPLIDGETEYPVTDGKLVITLDGQVSFIPDSDLDHSASEERNHTIKVTTTDEDGDALTSTVELTITDGQNPVITSITEATVYEAGLTDGSGAAGQTNTEFSGTLVGQLGSDEVTGFEVDLNAFASAQQNDPITSQGKTIVLEAVGGQPGVYLGYITLDNGTRVDVLKVTIGAVSMSGTEFSSDYKVELLQEIDQPKQGGAAANDFSTISLPIFATDSDKDESARSDLIIKVGDDIQVVADGEITVTEPTIGDTVQSTVVNVITEAGADQATVSKVTFDGVDVPLVDGETEYSVTDGVLVVTLDGQVSFKPNAERIHPDDDRIEHTIVVTVTDKDGDKTTSTVDLVIKDGQDPVITQITEANVYEAGLTDGGSQVGPTDYVSEGKITVVTGSDDVIEFHIDVEAFNLLPANQGLYSNSERVVIEELSTGVYRGFITKEINGVDTEIDVFKVSFDQADLGKYKFELLQEVDHANQGQENLEVKLPIYAVDRDGDESGNHDLVVNIGDDMANIDDFVDGSTFTVNEDDTINGSSPGQAFATGTFDTNQGADTVVKYELTNINTSESGLKSGGVDVEIKDVSDATGPTVYHGVANGIVVFTLELFSDGSYIYSQIKALDHAEGEDSLTIPFDVVALDRDGDVSQPIRLPIEVVDDKPTIKDITETKVVDEDDLSTIGSDQNQRPEVSGTFDVTEGADGVVKYELVDANNAIDGLVSGSENLVWAPVSTSGTTFTYTAQTASGTPVFTITFDTDDNSYKFELLEPLQHASGSGENAIDISLSIKATDYDGDESNVITLPIRVVDDIPELTQQSITRFEGQGYKGSTVNMFDSATDMGADGAVLTKLEGTTDTADGSSIVFRSGGSYVDSVDLSEGSQTIRVYQDLNDGNPPRQLGVLQVDSNGEIEFKANNYLEHDGSNIEFTIDVTATDGDLDTSTAPLDITITDRDAKPIKLTVQTFEDSGRDSSINYATGDEPERSENEDNQTDLQVAPANVALAVNLFDDDNGESINTLTIKAGSHNGTFYYKDGDVYHELEVDPATGNLILSAPLLQQSLTDSGNNTIATITNLYFVPDRHYSSNDKGVKINYDLEIGNNGTDDHTVSSNFRIEVDSVADIATWIDADSQYEYQVAEDDGNVQIKLDASTLDISNPETITYELEVTQGAGEFELLGSNGQPLTPEGGVYTISAADINSIQVKPNEHFSGQIRFEAVAVTEETKNPYNEGTVDKSEARSEPQELIIDVTPDADAGSFSVSRIKINEDNIKDPDYIGPDDNHKPFTLDQVIDMKPSVDVDGSESLHIRISNITESASLKWVGDGDSQITEVTVDGVTYQEIPYDQLVNVEVIPELHSNIDFKFDVTGVVKDSALLSDGTVHVDEEVLGTKTVNVEVTGVADIPRGNTLGSDWSGFEDNGVSGVEITIKEDAVAELNFTVISGEALTKPQDGSESLTVLLSGIPEGVILEDADGDVIDLNFTGYETGPDGQPDTSKPIYEANITGIHDDTGIIIKPAASSTENIHIKATVIVTENDGHTLSFEQEVRVKVEPVIDAKDTYTNTASGYEDTPIDIDWYPEKNRFPDSDEHFTSIEINGVPDGAQVAINGNVNWSFDSDTGKITITPLDSQTPEQFSDIALNSDFVQITLPKDSSTNFDLTTIVNIEERDHEYTSDDIVGEGGRVTGTITGTIAVDVTPIVERVDGSNRLVVENENQDVVGDEVNKITADDKGVIRFTTNADSADLQGEYIIRYQETDATDTQYESTELVTQLVIQFENQDEAIMDQLFITGAVYEGNGRWVIVDEENFSINAPAGLDLTPDKPEDDDLNGISDIDIIIYAQVIDQGDIDDPKRTPGLVAQRETSVTLSFPEYVEDIGTKGAFVDIADNSIILGTEDTTLDLGAQLKPLLSVSSGDDTPDTLTIVIDDSFTENGKTFDIGISGANVDFTNGQYVFTTTIDKDGNIGSLDGLQLTLPKDYSGDFSLPITIIATDTLSGHSQTNDLDSVVVNVSPVADVTAKVPKITLDIVESLDDDMNVITQTGDAKGFEDSYIKLDLGYTLADKVTGLEGGEEVVSSVTLTLEDGTPGQFYDASGAALGSSITFDQSQIEAGALDNILFRPDLNYPSKDGGNTINIKVTGTVTDTATFDLADPDGTASDTKPFEADVSFDVEPVVDGVIVTGPGSDADTIELTGLEDTEISLGASGPVNVELTDNDGSESFVSLKLTGIPDGFVLVTKENSEYEVKNNGGGEWSVKLPKDAESPLDLSDILIHPPKNFSGTAEFGMTVYIQEDLLGVPTEAANLPNFVLTVTPEGDAVDVDATDSISGLEGQNIDIDINAFAIDNADTATGSGTYTENAPETLRVEVTNVPDDAKIYYPDGGLASFENGVWTLDIAASSLDKIIFNSGEHNSDTGNVDGITEPIHISVQAVDRDASGTEYLGDKNEFDVELVIDPVNDQPTFEVISDLATEEDTITGVAINNLTIADIDATYDDPDAEYTLTLQVDKGSLAFTAYVGVNFELQPDGSLVLTGKLADINSALGADSVIFKPDLNSNDLNSGGPVTVTATVDDGGNNGVIDPGDSTTSSSNQTSFIINVSEVNDQPVAGDLDLGSIEEDTGSIQITMAQLIAASSDIDNDTLKVDSITVPPEQGTLTLSDDGTYWTFKPAPEFNGKVTISYVIEDNGTTNGANDFKQDSGEVTLTVIGVNDKPEIDISDITTLIDESPNQLISGISVSDIDYVDQYADDPMTVTITVDYGALTLVQPNDSNVAISGEGTSTVTLTGTLTELNALLDEPNAPNGLFIDASLSPVDSINLQVTAKDSGNPSGLALDADPKDYVISVTPVANAPTLSIEPSFNHVRNITTSVAASSSGIALVGIMAALTDINEALTLEISGLPPEASLTSSASGITYDNQADMWIVPAGAIDDLKVVGATEGNYTFNVTAVSTETDGKEAKSAPIPLSFDVVADADADINKSSETDDLQLHGSDDANILTAGSGDDLLIGGEGNDTLIAGAGDDTLIGGAGNDILDGGLGSDILTGGTGEDTFIWHEIDDGAADTITDFKLSEGDQIDLRDVLPELKETDIDMTTLLQKLDAKVVDGDGIELTLHGENDSEQTILVEHLAPQLTLDGTSSSDIVSALLDQHVITHDTL